ncbi:hypothetical protein EON65_31165 [archaeon]|nr:MAG: hypothetical protein EON65_31165 [archaeon]
MNLIAARMLCHLTASSRFHGEMNVDMNEIYTNLVPFPRMHFLLASMSLRQPKKTAAAGGRLQDVSHSAIQRAFGDLIGSKGRVRIICVRACAIRNLPMSFHVARWASNRLDTQRTAGNHPGLGLSVPRPHASDRVHARRATCAAAAEVHALEPGGLQGGSKYNVCMYYICVRVW